MGSIGLLKSTLEDAVCGAVRGKNIAVAFSGGLDSGVIAALTRSYAESVTLYTVGTDDAYDVVAAESSARELGMPWIHIQINENYILEGLRDMISLTGTKDPVILSFELPLFFVCRNCTEHEIITGQGADELFAGYSKYIGLGKDELKAAVARDMAILKKITLPHEKKVADHFGKNLYYPFLNEKVIGDANDLTSESTVSSDPLSRKWVLREVSDLIGCKSISVKEKKAAQYGSGSMALIRKKYKKSGVTYPELIYMLSEEV
jgi:asparagine synthase (glutamine-hydrolysing)